MHKDDLLEELLREDDNTDDSTQEDDTEEYHVRDSTPNKRRRYKGRELAHYNKMRVSTIKESKESKKNDTGETIEYDDTEDDSGDIHKSSFPLWVLIPVGIAGIWAIWKLSRGNNNTATYYM